MKPDLKKSRAAFAALVRSAGIDSITVSFEGSGDSGSIEDVYVTPATVDLRAPFACALPLAKTRYVFNNGTFKATHYTEEKNFSDLHELITEFAYNEISLTDVDWYNNDGGGGSWELNNIQTDDPLLTFTVYQYETIQRDAYFVKESFT
jgi:hypothetical protein